MRSAHFFLALALLMATTFSCARRKKANIPNAPTTTAAPTPASAPAVPVERRAARDLTDVMTDELKLLPDQQTKVRAILTSTVEQVNDAQKKHGADRAALMTDLKAINARSEGQLKQVLTPTQYQQYQTKKRAMQAQMQSRKASGQ
ncbi:hypothetical protein ACW9KT_02670 [Hymenobacter sp. HD11105]|jgi:hypothetical protein